MLNAETLLKEAGFRPDAVISVIQASPRGSLKRSSS